ncbi:hypothetical protein [Natronincola ferrireducens]|uniref:Uncharacterized protein n=1 Tax=Natronincola ferrireducens TaxID=393762 RepID=A0A1G8ZPI5_9FIRM|nr:hypothetical protein [Natronincola ferrireducens]SDK16961.1 hypothetical protein SAMN05660472_00925 [Natronincola ferrireducens]
MYFFKNSKEEAEFIGGKSDWTRAKEIAETCLFFKEDVEDELVADDLRSCYNCRLRRWTEKSFVCCGDLSL